MQSRFRTSRWHDCLVWSFERSTNTYLDSAGWIWISKFYISTDSIDPMYIVFDRSISLDSSDFDK